MGYFLDTVWFALRMHLAGTWHRYLGVIVLVVAAFFLIWQAFIAPPANAATGIIIIPSGKPLSVVAEELRTEHILRSPFTLKLILYAVGRERNIQAGAYEFKGPESALTVARRIASGDTQIVPTRVTLTEGMASFDMARELATAIPGFDAAAFETLAAAHEGYLFPDTYFFLPTLTPQEAVAPLTTNFDTRTAVAMPAIAASGHSLADVVTMASIVEREAKTPEDRRIVAGILWNRIAIGMRLQVDAVFGYLHKQDNYQTTSADTSTDSPYNTYRNAGLPPGPISNPGLDAIEAAATPTKSDYLYYVSGKDGVMHYAKTFAQHEQNIKEYL